MALADTPLHLYSMNTDHDVFVLALVSPVLKRRRGDNGIKLKASAAFLSLCCPLANYEHTGAINGDEWVQMTKRHDGAGRLTIGHRTKKARGDAL